MAASYKKLWKLLIDKDMKKEDLRKAAGITTTAMAKLGRNETVHMDILLKICKYHCSKFCDTEFFLITHVLHLPLTVLLFFQFHFDVIQMFDIKYYLCKHLQNHQQPCFFRILENT